MTETIRLPGSSSLRALAQLGLLAMAMAIGGYVRTAISPLQETMRIAMALSDNQMAILQGTAVGVPVTLAAIPLGLLIDRITRIRLLQMLIMTSLAASLLTAIAESFFLLLAARAVAGVTGLGVLPVVFSIIADLYEPAKRGRATTVIIIGQVIGNSAAFALGGWLLARSGVDDAGWRTAMLWLSAPIAVGLVATLLLVEPQRRGQKEAHPTLRVVWRELKAYRSIVGLLSTGVILVETGIGAILIWGAPMLSRRFALPPDQVGAILAMAMLVSGILGPIVGGTVADLCQRRGGPRQTGTALILLAILSAPLSLFAFADSVLAVSILLVCDLTLLLAAAVAGMALFTVVIPNELRGLCMSMLIAAILLFSLAVAPPVVSLAAQALGGEAWIGAALSIVSAVASLSASIIFLLGRSRLPEGAI